MPLQLLLPHLLQDEGPRNLHICSRASPEVQEVTVLHDATVADIHSRFLSTMVTVCFASVRAISRRSCCRSVTHPMRSYCMATSYSRKKSISVGLKLYLTNRTSLVVTYDYEINDYNVSSCFVSHPITVVSKYCGGRMHGPSSHLKFWGDRPPSCP